jgi:hypothetical protein
MFWFAAGDGFRRVALHGVPPALAEYRKREQVFRFDGDNKAAKGSRRRGTNYRFTPSVFGKRRRRVVQCYGAESISLP